MPRLIPLLAALLALAMAAAPGAALARAGDSSSMGSRGSRTYSAPPPTNTAPYTAPLQRSLTAPTTPRGGMMGGYGNGMRPSFLSGLFGGLIGAGLAGMLLGHGFFWGMGSFGGIIGLVIQIALIVWLVRILARRVTGMSPRGAGFVPFSARAAPSAASAGGGRPAPAIGAADFQAFEQALYAIQAAWSAHDLAALRRLATPEMVSYFAEQLAEQTSRGVRNVVRDVRLDRGDLAEAWSENGRDYATVAMQFSMIDVTLDATGRVVDGSPGERVSATELWTFLRAPGGAWILSAIQQAR
ncbi:MAG: Tim44 domain-containing protein [Acidibrevibacterium sp.]|uniref:Tim44 domain-containing protein n=1 Tax=Acidibrevibacterium sp. TaxID=2606776 RepID=UPI003D04598F